MAEQDFDAARFEREFERDRRSGIDRRVKRGFACGDNAAKAARKNHELGTAHRWTAHEARGYSKVGSDAAQERRERERRESEAAALSIDLARRKTAQ